ncbi:MAG TPA: AMIN domain-containing protein, partial [Pseudomonadales bacterium]|nr:AMIN domain-containing protein [Pseudomonadales bacterium]
MAITTTTKVTAKSTRNKLPVLARLLVAVLTLMPFAAYAVTMQNIEFSSMPGDKTEIKMSFDGVPPKPTGYTIEQPARIALDLVGVTSALKSKYHALGNGNARSVTVVEAGDRTRVIVSMTQLTPYSTRVDGDNLYLLVGKPNQKGMMSSAQPETFPAEEKAQATAVQDQSKPEIENIDFRRGENGEGRVIVKLSDPGVGIDVSTRGGKIRMEFADTHLPESLQRRLDVTDFATPVVTVDALPDADNTVITVEPTGDYDYLAYQADNVFTLEVKPVTAGAEGANGQTPHFKYHGEKLSLNFQDIEVRSVLQLIADFTDLNL